MADKKISELDPATTPLTGAEEVPLDQMGATRRATVDDIAARAIDQGLWEYGTGTLQPDPTNTTPLHHFLVTSDTDFSLIANDGTTTHLLKALAGSIASSVTENAGPTLRGNLEVNNSAWTAYVNPSGSVIAQASGNATQIELNSTDGTNSSILDVNAAGSFLLTADDGNNAYTVQGVGGTLSIATTGPSGNVTVNADNNVDIEAETNATLGAVGNVNVASSAGNVVISSTTGGVSIDATAGLVHIEGDHTSGVEIIATDVEIAMALNRIEMTGSSVRLLNTYVNIQPGSQLQIPVVAATTLGTVVGKIAIFNGSGAAGSLVGYLPIYDTIT